MTMITKVFTTKNETKTKDDAYKDLVNLNSSDKYKKQKAAGSLGGSSRSGFIKRNDSKYERMK